MLKVYQNISLSVLHEKVNAMGWDAAAREYPSVKAYLDCSIYGSEKWNPDYFKHFFHVATIDTDDLDEAFEIGNIGPAEKIEGQLEHSVSVGDILVDANGNRFMVNSIGFSQVA